MGSYVLSRTAYYATGSYFFSYALTSFAYLTLYFDTASGFESAISTTAHAAIIVASILLPVRGLVLLVMLSTIATFAAPYYSQVPMPAEGYMRVSGVFLSIGLILIGANVFRTWIEKARLEELAPDDAGYEHAEGIAKITICRPEVRNAFRPQTLFELSNAFERGRNDPAIGVVILTGEGTQAFCSGGDQRIRGKDGYKYADGDTADTIDPGKTGRLHILEVQRLIRFMPKVVIAVVPGWAVGGGHSLHVVCDLTLASEEHAVFKQTDADVASYDAGYGSAYLARQVGQKRAREIFFLGRDYTAQEAYEMGMVNAVVPHARLEQVALEWAREIVAKSPMSQRMLKLAFNLIDDGLVGQQLFAGEATRLGYMTEEAQEGRDAFLEKRNPDYSRFPWHY